MELPAGTSGWILDLIKTVVIPETMAVVRAHHNAGLPPPTKEQILAATELTEDRIIAIGEGFLAGLPKPAVLPPTSFKA